MIPEPRSLDYEDDFIPPCSYDDPAFVAMHQYNVKPVVSGKSLYTPGNMPPLAADPLATLAECAGEGMIAAITSPADLYGTTRIPDNPFVDVRDRYIRAKTVLPDVPALMFHATIPAYVDRDNALLPVTTDEVASYLIHVFSYSQFADMIGFTVYPVGAPVEMGAPTTPYQVPDKVSAANVVPDYLRWLHNQLPDHTYIMVLQGFSFFHLYSGVLGSPIVLQTEDGLRVMACQAYAGGSTVIAWWGQSFLYETDAEFWDMLLDVSAEIATDAAGYCTHAQP